jgi:hypothetical protein
MPSRTTIGAVKGLLNRDYDSARNPSLQVFIDSASIIVDQVILCARRKSITLSNAQLELIERWLSAHFYTKNDPLYQSKSTGGASGSFIGNPQQPERYKDGALMVDTSGCLAAILSRNIARMKWIGKTVPEELDFEHRN